MGSKIYIKKLKNLIPILGFFKVHLRFSGHDVNKKHQGFNLIVNIIKNLREVIFIWKTIIIGVEI